MLCLYTSAVFVDRVYFYQLYRVGFKTLVWAVFTNFSAAC